MINELIDLKEKLHVAMSSLIWYRLINNRAQVIVNAEYMIICDMFADIDRIDAEYARDAWNEKAPEGCKFL